jgi:hypothetical protein
MAPTPIGLTIDEESRRRNVENFYLLDAKLVLERGVNWLAKDPYELDVVTGQLLRQHGAHVAPA